VFSPNLLNSVSVYSTAYLWQIQQKLFGLISSHKKNKCTRSRRQGGKTCDKTSWTLAKYSGSL